MSLKRRILKWGVIGLLVLLFAAWFGFTTFFFNPLEDDYEYDVSTLVPRNVDFFVAKAGLAGDLDADLELEITDDLAASPRVQALRKLPAVQDVLAAVKLAEVREEVQASLASLPIRVDPVELFGGRDLALAGYFPEQQGGEVQWAAYGRTNWMGKLGLALLGHPGLLDLEAQGIGVEEVEDPEEKELGLIAYRLSGGQLQRPLYVHRLQDVLVVGTDVELFRQMPALARQRGQDSFGLSARYEDQINRTGRDGDEVELFLDYRALAESRGWTGRWPDMKSDEFAPAFLGLFFQSGSINDLIGTLQFGTVSGLRMHATLSSELLTAVQKRLYRQRGIAKETLLNDVASLIPADAGVFVAGAGDIGDLLREALKAGDDDTVSLLEDTVRSVWSYADAQPLIDDLDATFADRFAFCMVDNDYPVDPGAAPNDGAIVPAWAVALWVDDEAKARSLRETITSNQGAFQIHGREPGSQGVWTYTLPGGWLCYEYWSPFVPGTGHMASINAVTSGPTLVFGNHSKLLADMMNAFSQRGEGGPPALSDHPTFRTQVNAGLPSSSFVLWANPRAMGRTWRGMSDRWARDKVVIDWDLERPRILQKVLKEKMPDATWGALTPDQEAELDMLAQPEIDAFDERFRSQHEARIRREIADQIDALEGVEALLVEIGLDKADLDVVVRLKYPLEPSPQP
jgi:hypothetical protein